MKLTEHLRGFSRLFAGLVRAPQRPSTPREFSAMVCRERARADRSGGDFSVVTFRGGSSPGEADVLRRVAKHLAERARIIDQYGWNGESAVWLLLPHCPPTAAEKIAQ